MREAAQKENSSSIQVHLSESLDISNLLELALQNLGYSKEKIIHYTFLIEEAIYQWRERLPAESRLEFRRNETVFDIVFRFAVPGEKVNPWEFQANDGEEAAMVRAGDRLLSGVGRELRYRYRRCRVGNEAGCGINLIELKLPKKNADTALFRRAVLWLMIPFALQLMVENIATSVDTIMMGFLDSNMMSAISLASGYNMIPSHIIDALIVVETMLMAQLWGQRKRRSVYAVYQVTTIVGGIVSVLFFAVTEIFAKQIMSLYTNIPEVMEEGAVYLRTIAASYLMIPVYRTYYCFMRTTGAVRKSVVFTSIGCAVNVLMNFFLIFGLCGIPRLGPLGAGIATVCSCLVQVFLVVFYGHRYNQQFLQVADTMEDRPNLKQMVPKIFSKSWITIIKYLVYVLGTNIIAAAFGHMGTDIMAANALIATITCLFLSFKDGMGSAVGVLMGALLGKRKMEEAWQFRRVAYQSAAMVAFFVIVALGVTSFLLQFSSIALSNAAMRYYYLFLVGICINIFFGFMNAVSTVGCLYAGGQVMPVLVIDTVVMLLVLSPVAILLIHTDFLPVIPVLMFLKLDELISAPMKYFFVMKKKWMKKL